MNDKKIEQAKRSATCRLMKAAVESFAQMFEPSREGAPSVKVMIDCKNVGQSEYELLLTWPDNQVTRIRNS